MKEEKWRKRMKNEKQTNKWNILKRKKKKKYKKDRRIYIYIYILLTL